MLNYFSCALPEPNEKAPIAITMELSRCPWNAEHQLAMVALSSYAPAKENQPGSNLVFLADVSGSMEASNRLPLIRKALIHSFIHSLVIGERNSRIQVTSGRNILAGHRVIASSCHNGS